MRLLEAGEFCGMGCPLPGSVIVYGGVSINADDTAYSECKCFPPEQKVIQTQIDAAICLLFVPIKYLTVLLEVLDHIQFQNFLLAKFSPVF